MTSTHRENIPFFSDLPTKAYLAASRLWDAMHRPDYNGAQAYNDFVQDLTFQGVTAPPRAVVKRWQAGVQSGLIDRPTPAEPAAAKPASEAVTSSAFFDTLPPTAMPAVQAAWDRASADGFSDAFILSSLTKELAELGHTAPTKGQFAHWLKAVRGGEIPRPGNSVSTAPAFEKLTPDTFASSSYDTLRDAGVMPVLFPITPIEFIEQKPDPALVMIRDRMVEEMVAHLTANARATAEATVAARFRLIAETMGGAA